MSTRLTTKRVYKIQEGSIHEAFAKSRAKIQFFGGGFANGKTAAVCVLKALQVAKDYPGANILMARSTYPKLNDTLRKEFLKWCPRDWIESFPMSAGGTNTCTLKNGTTINFRYVAQQGKSEEATTSNLLSATYDLIVIDQIEDPEIVEKDFDDLLGRLRGMARYIGNDPTMPNTGPRWLVITSNPTRNWVYRKLIKPLHSYHRTGIKSKDLIVDVDTGEPLMALFEGSTYENAANLEADFIKTLEATYRGQMRDRFLMGQWAAYEGLVYPSFDETQHCVSADRIRMYLSMLRREGYEIEWLEGYDYGLAQQACYLLAFVDPYGNVIVCDGFYEAEISVAAQESMMKEIRKRWNAKPQHAILADPSIFKRQAGDKYTVGKTIAQMFDLPMQRGNNDKINGIVKVSSYLHVQDFHVSPFTKTGPAPYIFFAEELEFIPTEFGDYYWKKDTKTGEPIDEPNGHRDHAMDTIKYLLSRRPKISGLSFEARRSVPKYMSWGERELPTSVGRSNRHLSAGRQQ